MNQKAKFIVTLVILVCAAAAIWYLKNNETGKAVDLLAQTYNLESKCADHEKVEFPMEPFDNAILDPDCVKNAIEFASITGFDLNKNDPEKNCKCLKLNLDKVLEKYGTAENQCLLIQAKNFVVDRCKELSVK